MSTPSRRVAGSRPNEAAFLLRNTIASTDSGVSAAGNLVTRHPPVENTLSADVDDAGQAKYFFVNAARRAKRSSLSFHQSNGLSLMRRELSARKAATSVISLRSTIILFGLAQEAV